MVPLWDYFSARDSESHAESSTESVATSLAVATAYKLPGFLNN